MKKDKGYTLITSLAIGTLITGIASVSLLNSNKEKVNTISNEYNKQATAIAEGKISKFFSKANDKLLKINYSNWNTSTASSTDCDNKDLSNELTNYVEIVDYNFNPQNNNGTLIVDGETNNSITRLKVTFPIIETIKPNKTAIPALMATKFNVQQSDILANNILCTDPENCPSVCNPNQSDLKQALGSTKNSIISGTINVSDANIPDIPDIPENAYPNNLGNITNKNLTLPLNSDIISPDGNYYYLIENITRSSILVKDNINVRLYVKGNITQSGNNNIKPINVNQPGQIHLYGDSETEQSWLFSGTACVNAFIHAPNANIGINGGGNGCGPDKANILGVAWVKSYNVIGNPSNSSIFVEQPGLLNKLESNNVNYTINDTNISNITKFERLSL